MAKTYNDTLQDWGNFEKEWFCLSLPHSQPWCPLPWTWCAAWQADCQSLTHACGVLLMPWHLGSPSFSSVEGLSRNVVSSFVPWINFTQPSRFPKPSFSGSPTRLLYYSQSVKRELTVQQQYFAIIFLYVCLFVSLWSFWVRDSFRLITQHSAHSRFSMTAQKDHINFPIYLHNLFFPVTFLLIRIPVFRVLELSVAPDGQSTHQDLQESSSWH